MRPAGGPRAALLVLLALGPISCLLPMRSGQDVAGRVVDRETGSPVADAVVVVRWDGRYGEDLPDRELLGHAEARTGPNGRFAVAGTTRGGLTFWPFFRTEARVVGVMHPDYRCPLPLKSAGRELSIRLHPAGVEEERRDSCRPVRAQRGEADEYMTAWRQLFPSPETAEKREQREQLERLLEARAALGFGENCEGPVLDLALSPDGRRAAFVTASDGVPAVYVSELGAEGAFAPSRVKSLLDRSTGRLAWTAPGELVLWQPSTEGARAVSPSIFAPTPSQVLWSDERAFPAAMDRDAASTPNRTSPRRPLDPADLRDEADSRWQGRSFTLLREVDPLAGLPRDSIRVTELGGAQHTVELPGEACGGARFGRPHYRIDASTQAGLDLRFVDGGCHLVRIDLEDGSWTQVDAATAPALCRGSRRVPPAQLSAALRGWTRELRQALERAGADTSAAYSLEIDQAGSTRASARDFSGRPVILDGPAFPLETPLRRIDVANIAPSRRGGRGVAQKTPPIEVLEPL